jgi:ubiquinone/menaquinone biosynthesis C-methylase UbiE
MDYNQALKDEILQYIYDKSPTQKKRLLKVLSENPEMSEELELFLVTYSIFMENSGLTYKDICDAYLLMISQVIHSRIYFLRTGLYPAMQYKDEIITNIYDNEKVMTSYMLGLALSQFLWEHHFEVFKFYRDTINKLTYKTNVIEIGPGHGVFLLELLKTIDNNTKIDCIDISMTSLNISKKLISAIRPDIFSRIRFIQGDINLFNEDKTYDFITLGEVLEHVDDPLKILSNINRILDKNGTFFLTTCIDCPMIDHIYHFSSVTEIEELIAEAGFKITDKITVTTENMDKDKQKKYKPDVKYAAVLNKAN